MTRRLSNRIASCAVPALLVVLGACAGRPAAAPADPQPMVVSGPIDWKGDVDLAPVLVQPELNAAVLEGAERVEIRLGPAEFAERLGVVAEDTTAPWLVRLNSLKLLAARGVLGELPAFVTALRASDERVRIAAATGMREYMSIRPKPAIEILALALRDPSRRVQTAALQVLADRDIKVLRDFLPRARDPDVRAVTLDLIHAAEERGAPLAGSAAGGVLERTAANGAKLTFRPTRSWPDWNAAVGELALTMPGAKPVVVAGGVEEVGNVVPAFFTPDGKSLVYEVNREIHARDLATGGDRKLADGIAPRVLPFTNDVIFFDEIRNRRSETPNSFGMKYEVKRVPAAGGTPEVIGEINASALNAQNGNYVNLRWSRIEEDEGTFYLVGERIDSFQLPSPFGSP